MLQPNKSSPRSEVEVRSVEGCEEEGAERSMEYTRERECEDDGQIEIERRKDSEGTAQIEALEADRTCCVHFLEQQAGDEKAADHEEHRNTGMREEQIGARWNPDPPRE